MVKSWFDERVKWDPKEYENISEITLPVNNLWVPDIVLQVTFFEIFQI